MKKLLGFLSISALAFSLAACGDENNSKKDSNNNSSQQSESNVEKNTASNYETTKVALKEPDENTKCDMCNMKVYEKADEMGKFSAQAIKADGSIVFYDDIGCLLNAELKNNETNEKYVRDFNTLEWILVDDATIVKTNLKTPMNWGYAFFKSKEDAEQYVKENEGTYIEKLETVKQKAKERFEAKMKQQEGKKNNSGNMHNMNHNDQNDEHENM